MEQISKLFGRRKRTKARSQRDELLEYFAERINRDRDGDTFAKLPIPYFARKLAGLKLPDLLYMRSVMNDIDRRGGDASKWFWWSLKAPEED